MLLDKQTDDIPHLQEISDLTTIQLKQLWHRLKNTSTQPTPFLECLLSELEDREEQDLIGFFQHGSASELRQCFMNNPFVDKLRAFNDQLLSMVERESKSAPKPGRDLTHQGFGVRKMSGVSDKQKEALGRLMEKTLAKTKMMGTRVLHSSHKQLPPNLSAQVILKKRSEEDHLPQIKQKIVLKKVSSSTHHITKNTVVQQVKERTKQKSSVTQRMRYKPSQRPNSKKTPQQSPAHTTHTDHHRPPVPPSQGEGQQVSFQAESMKSDQFMSNDCYSTHKLSSHVSGKSEVEGNQFIQQAGLPFYHSDNQRNQHVHNQQAQIKSDMLLEGLKDVERSEIQESGVQTDSIPQVDMEQSKSHQLPSQLPQHLSQLQTQHHTQKLGASSQTKIKETVFRGSIGNQPRYPPPLPPSIHVHNLFQISVHCDHTYHSHSASPPSNKPTGSISEHLDSGEKGTELELEQSPFVKKKVEEKKMKKVKLRPLTKAELMIQRISDCLPTVLTDYTTRFKSFQELFPGHRKENFDLLDAMRHVRSVFVAHQKMVDHEQVMQACNRLAQISKTSVQQYYSENPQNVFVHAQATRIDLRRFVQKQKVLASRMTQDIEFPQELMFFRAVRAKQEVYDIVGRTFMRRNDWAELPHGLGLKTSWNLLWTWSRPQIDLSKLLVFQKINHFPSNRHLVRKDLLKKRIEGAKSLGAKARNEFDIIPKTYVLPKEYCQFVDSFLENENYEGPNYWIMKPVGKSRGRGIIMVHEIGQVLYNEPVVIQQYLRNPLLLDGRKFDMRVYVLVTSMQPLQAFVYNEGFARFSSEEYTTETSSLDNHMIHLTNYSIQKNKADPHSFGGPKTSFKTLEKKLMDSRVPWDVIWRQVIDIVIKSLVACEDEIGNCPNSFQLFGYDILIDSNLRCWLIEVNASPSLERDFILDDLIKQQLLDDIIELLDPPYFDRSRLLEILERRIYELEGRKSTINVSNRSSVQLNRDLNYILKSKPWRGVGEKAEHMGGFEQIAPSEKSQRLKRLIKSYKVS